MTNKKQALGKGLDALLGNMEADYSKSKKNFQTQQFVPENGSISEIDVTLIETNPFQPRTEFEKEALLELAESIKELGVIQPITVRKLADQKYQLISGERRLRASQAAGLTKVPAYIRVANDQAMLEMALVENIQRRDLNAIEVAISYQRLIDECDLTQDKLAKRVGKNRTSVTNFLRLLNLPPEIQSAIIDKQISFGHARALSALSDEDVQVYIKDKIVKDGLSVRQAESLVKESKENSKSKKTVKKKESLLSFQHQKFQEDLADKLQSKIELKVDSKGTGKIVIPFKSEAELEKLIKLLEV